MKTLSLDFSYVFSDQLGKHALKYGDLEDLAEKAEAAKKRFDSEAPGFCKLPEQGDELKVHLDQVRSYVAKNRFDTLVVVGIGGSDLGARALHRALNHQYYNELSHQERGENALKIYFSGDTTDPVAIKEIFSRINPTSTLFLVISKSGNTIEQASSFIVFREMLSQKLEKSEINKHFIFLTDPETGTLRKLAQEKGYMALPVPQDVGGRFSVLSTVGMIPASLVGLNVQEFLNGAAQMSAEISDNDVSDDVALKYALISYLYVKREKNISVIMPYIYSLREFALWFRQLWAESLGKKVAGTVKNAEESGNEVFAGVTPAAALGPTDQHSQLQLYNEGPNDKLITFIINKNSKRNIQMPDDYSELQAYKYFQGWSLQDILLKEFETTRYALVKNKRPNITISIDELTENSLGQLFYFFEVSVTYLGYLLEINPFDQPGVELSKNAMYGVLGKSGYEEERQKFQECKQHN